MTGKALVGTLLLWAAIGKAIDFRTIAYLPSGGGAGVSGKD